MGTPVSPQDGGNHDGGAGAPSFGLAPHGAYDGTRSFVYLDGNDRKTNKWLGPLVGYQAVGMVRVACVLSGGPLAYTYLGHDVARAYLGEFCPREHEDEDQASMTY